jgi:hypothetical protein
MLICPSIVRKYSWTLPSDSIHKDNVKTKGIGIVSPIDLHIDFKKRY